MLTDFLSEARRSVRSLRRAPLFTFTVVATLTLGIGANAAVFAVVERLFLREAPGVLHPELVDRLALTAQTGRVTVRVTGNFWNYPAYRALANGMPTRIATAAYATDPTASFGEQGHARVGTLGYVIDDYFGVLGASPALGRFFTKDEAGTKALSPVAVISYSMWQSDFGGAPDVIGRPLKVASHHYTIIGVSSPTFSGTDLTPVDAWVPRNTLGSWDDWSPARAELPMMHFLEVIVRLGSHDQTAAAEVTGTRIVREGGFTTDSTAALNLVPITSALDVQPGSTTRGLTIRLAIVALVILLVSATNAANILLARAVERRREIATRVVLGAPRTRIMAEVFTEAVILAALAGVATLLCTTWLTRALGHALIPTVAWAGPVLDVRLAAFVAASILAAAGIAGVLPALQASRLDIGQSLQGAHNTGSPQIKMWRGSLLFAQVSLSTLLLVAGAILVRSLQNVESIDLGFDTDRVVLADIAPSMSFTSRDAEAYRQIGASLPDAARQLAGVPGVEQVALADRAPMNYLFPLPVFLPGRDTALKLNQMPPFSQIVSANFFAAMGRRLLEGRAFSDADRQGSAPVAIVSSAMARATWPGRSAIGQCVIMMTRNGPCRTVVGVVADGHLRNVVAKSVMQVYLPLAQADSSTYPSAIVLRVAPSQVDAVVRAARSTLAPLGDRWGAAHVVAMRDVLAPELQPWRVAATLFGTAAILALLVAAVGIYGSVAYGVSQRTREIGIRIALGARRIDVLKVVTTRDLSVVASGLAAGIVTSLAFQSVLASMLYGTTSHDPAALLGVCAAIFGASTGACLVPSMRALRADPVESLRAE